MKRLLTFAALFTGLLSQSFAALALDLSFDTTDLAAGDTGTFTLTGTFSPSGYGSSSGPDGTVYNLSLPQGGGTTTPDTSYFYLNLSSTSLTGNASYDSTPFTFDSVGLSFMFDPMMSGPNVSFNGSLYSGSQTSGLSNSLVTVDFSGSFEIGGGYGSADLSVLSGSYANGNVNVLAYEAPPESPAVPEPSTYAAIFGALALAFVGFRRRKA